MKNYSQRSGLRACIWIWNFPRMKQVRWLLVQEVMSKNISCVDCYWRRGTVSLMGPLFISPDDGRMNMEQRWNDNREGKTELLEYKHFPVPLRQPQIPHGAVLELNLGVRSVQPATTAWGMGTSKKSTSCMVQEEKEWKFIPDYTASYSRDIRQSS
jgi:hypothetical protein